MSARIYTPSEILHLLLKHRWMVLVPLALGIAAAPILSRLATPLYRSEALLLVVPQQVPKDFVQPTVTETVAERLPSITAQILSRAKLERIVLDMDLYRDERSREVMEDVVERMRTRDIRTTPVGKEVDSFRVSYTSENAETARKVTEQLASLYIDQNERDRANQADSTSAFLATQLENTKQRLLEQEKKLEAYRRLHPGQLPSQLQGNLQAIESANLQLRAIHQATDRAEENRLRIEKQIADLEAFPVTSTTPSPTVDAALTPAKQLEQARAGLKLLMERYTPDHPDVVTAQRLVAELAARVDNETPLGAGDAGKPVASAEVLQQKKIGDLRGELQLINRQLEQQRGEEAQLRKIVSGYQANVDVLPTRESELTELTREYNTMLNYYNTLVTKREDAAVAANLERRRIGEQFRLLDPASRPQKPYNERQRLAITASGAILGLVLGFLAIAAREYRDSSFRSKDEVLKKLSLPVLASIPLMTSVRERDAAVRRRWAKDIAGSALLLASLAVVAVWRLYL